MGKKSKNDKVNSLDELQDKEKKESNLDELKDKEKKESNLDGLQDNIQNLLGDIQHMENKSFIKLLEDEKKKLMNMKKENPNNPLFQMLNDEEIDISQEDFIETCKTLMNGDITDNISKLFMGEIDSPQLDNKPEGDMIIEEETENDKDDNQAPDG